MFGVPVTGKIAAMKRLLNTLLIVSITLSAIAFATLNDSPAALNLFFWQTTERSLATWLILSFLIGLSIGGMLVYLNMWFTLRRKIRAKRQQETRHTATTEASAKSQADQEPPAAIAHD